MVAWPRTDSSESPWQYINVLHYITMFYPENMQYNSQNRRCIAQNNSGATPPDPLLLVYSRHERNQHLVLNYMSSLKTFLG